MVCYVFTYLYAMLFMCQRLYRVKNKKSENQRNEKK
ncbi:hypothetical protein T05_9294 [Trichinella murrelli]|uniref:Uncharacterized protein n=1 Tax=Trichinella murrelli TaxID=144512 RepID=A0A0V0SVR6_9BILA|nr:hypothetical protein T05_4040 [Trichinella murrelli]KRX30829.1 hypothetical protein T05_9294 [Trichinella murrelli]